MTTSVSNADVLRLALKLMTAHAEDYRPLTYTVWYEYALRVDKHLCERLEQVIASGQRLSGAATDEIYAHYLAGRRQQIISKAQASILQTLDDMSDAIGEAHQNTGRFAGHLRDFTDQAAQPLSPALFNESVRVITEQARQSGDELFRVQSRLRESEAEVKRLNDDLAQVRTEVYIDALSGLFNRRRFDAALDALVQQAVAEKQPLSLILIDIDKFKQVNDQHGHILGDQVIRYVSESIRASVKGRDIAARYGGDEFAVLLPETGLQGAGTVADYLRRVIERQRVEEPFPDGSALAITVSIGVATLKPGEAATGILGRADKALYQAKKEGRNRVVVT
jgi:diguanylate cyclase